MTGCCSCHYFAKESILFACFWKSSHSVATNLGAAAALGFAVFVTSSSFASRSTFGGFGGHYIVWGDFIAGFAGIFDMCHKGCHRINSATFGLCSW